MKRSSFTVRAATLLCALVLGSINVAVAATDHVKIGLASNYPANAIIAAAKELGLYAAQNLDVDVQPFRGAAAAQAALAAGGIDLCPTVPAAALHAIDAGAREHIVAMFAPARAVGWYIMVPASSPVKTLAGLNGKSVGVTQSGAQADLWVQRVAKGAHVSVTTVPLDAGVEAGLLAKRVDAALLGPPASYEGLRSGDLRALVDLEVALPPTITIGIAASGDLIGKRPGVLRRWLSATSKAVRYMQNNELWTEPFLKRYYGISDDQIVARIYHDVIMKINAGGVMHGDWMKTSLALGAPAGASNPPLTTKVFSTAFISKKGR